MWFYMKKTFILILSWEHVLHRCECYSNPQFLNRIRQANFLSIQSPNSICILTILLPVIFSNTGKLPLSSTSYKNILNVYCLITITAIFSIIRTATSCSHQFKRKGKTISSPNHNTDSPSSFQMRESRNTSMWSQATNTDFYIPHITL